MKQRIVLKESDLHKLIKESMKKVLKESYNDSQTVAKIKDLKQYLDRFIEYLEDKYDNIGSENDFLDKIYNGANSLYGDLYSFLIDDNRQSIYGY